MIKSKIFAIATIAYAALIQTALAKEISGKVGWLEADINADGVISFIEFQERDQFDTGFRDKDGDGLLSLDEFLQANPKKTGQKKLPKDFLEKQESLATKKFEKMDTDFNGFLDAAELQDARFDAMDQNGDGWLSYDEFRSAVREMDVSMNEEELKLACVYLDENRDGAIHWSEFVSKLVKGGMSLYDPFKAGRHRTIAALRE